MSEGDKKAQTSDDKTNASWGCPVQRGACGEQCCMCESH